MNKWVAQKSSVTKILAQVSFAQKCVEIFWKSMRKCFAQVDLPKMWVPRIYSFEKDWNYILNSYYTNAEYQLKLWLKIPFSVQMTCAKNFAQKCVENVYKNVSHKLSGKKC